MREESLAMIYRMSVRILLLRQRIEGSPDQGSQRYMRALAATRDRLLAEYLSVQHLIEDEVLEEIGSAARAEAVERWGFTANW